MRARGATFFTWFDRILLSVLVASIFFEPYLPYIGGSSTPFWIFVLATLYTLVTRFESLEVIVSSYYFIAVIVFAFVCALMESVHPLSDYSIVTRFLFMTSGMFCISILCRNSGTVDFILYAFIISSALEGIILIQGTLDFLHPLSASGFDEASRARIQAFEGMTVRDYVDDVSILSSIGAVMAMIAFYYEKKRWTKITLLFLLMLSLAGTFLPASRTGALVVLVSLIIFFVKSKVSWKKLLVPTVIIAMAMAYIIPQVVWERIGSTLKISEIREADSRQKSIQPSSGILMNMPWFAWAWDITGKAGLCQQALPTS